LSFTVEYLEYILLVFVRISLIVAIAPFFGNTNIPRKVKAAISFFIAIIVINTVDYTSVSYTGAVGYGILVLKEAITGALIGTGSGICIYILNFSGHMIDMEIGFAMAQEMDPLTNVNSTLTSNFFTCIFMLMFMVSDMHYYVLDAIFDSYKMIPIGGAKIDGGILSIMVKYITDYFVIGFRIILPIFSCILVINIVLGILAKVAPQINMFVVGMQLKLLVGLTILFFVLSMLSGVVDFIFREMQTITNQFIQVMSS